MTRPRTEAGRAFAGKAKREHWGNWEGIAQFQVPAIEAEASAAVLAELRAKVEAHARIPLYGDGWLPQWSHVDWHCRCGWWGNHGDSGYARHFREAVLALLSEDPA